MSNANNTFDGKENKEQNETQNKKKKVDIYEALYADFLKHKMQEKSKFEFLERFKKQTGNFEKNLIEEIFLFASNKKEFA
jgi:hypothetical protein